MLDYWMKLMYSKSPKFSTISLFVLSLLMFDTSLQAQNRTSETGLAGEIVQLRGNVTATDGSGLLPIPAVSEQITFQRVGCNRCLFAVRTNENGDYSVLLGKGRYKIYVWGFKNNRLSNIVSPTQSRIVTVKDNYRSTIFDILLTIPSLKAHPLIIGN